MVEPDLIDALVRHIIIPSFSKVVAHNLLEREITVEALELMHHRESSIAHIILDRAEKLVSINFRKLVGSFVDLHLLVDHLEAARGLESLVDALGCIVVEDGLTGGLVHDENALF